MLVGCFLESVRCCCCYVDELVQGYGCIAGWELARRMKLRTIVKVMC